MELSLIAFLADRKICFQLLYMSIIIQQRILPYKIQGGIIFIMRAIGTPLGICHPLWTNVRHFSTEPWCIISPIYYNVITAPCPRANENYEPLRKHYAALWRHYALVP